MLLENRLSLHQGLLSIMKYEDYFDKISKWGLTKK